MANIKKVLVVGGGIGGLTAAIALKQRGFEVDVVEINPAWSVYGVGIIQPSNALRAFAELGLGEKCLANGAGFPGWRICDANGNPIVDVPGDNVIGDAYPPINGIGRPALHRILTSTTLAMGIPVRLGLTVDRWEEDTDGVRVHFSDGAESKYDLVIGCDGTYSKMRTAVLGREVRPTFTGESVWRYNFERPADMEWGLIFYGSRSKGGFVPLTETQMYLFLVTAEPGKPHLPGDQLHELLKDRLAEYGGLVGRLREHIVDPDAVVYRPLEVVLIPEPWHRGRVVLIGDAAHSGTPHLAQGAAMAIEDAVLLAQMLDEDDDGLDSLLTRFAARRMPRCRLVMETGLKMGEWEMAEWSGNRLADTDHGGLMHEALTALMQPI